MRHRREAGNRSKRSERTMLSMISSKFRLKMYEKRTFHKSLVSKTKDLGVSMSIYLKENYDTIRNLPKSHRKSIIRGKLLPGWKGYNSNRYLKKIPVFVLKDFREICKKISIY